MAQARDQLAKDGLAQGWERSSQTPRSGTQFGIKPHITIAQIYKEGNLFIE
jgi:hypothetical protein